MKHCAVCSRSRIDGNLWCQEKLCPAEHSPTIFLEGTFIANMEILCIEALMPTSVLYRVDREGETIWLKVAHDGYEEKLKREARFLVKHRHPGLMKLLSAHTGADVVDFPYGRSSYNGHSFTYMALQSIDGMTLRELLQRKAQPWHQTSGWLVANLSDVIAFLHQQDLFHFCLSPEIVFVRFDQKGVPRPILLDLGVASHLTDSMRNWQKTLCTVGYAPPESVNQQPFSEATDVFGLGSVLHEMLFGTFLHYQNNGRPDLAKLPQLAERATAFDVKKRPLHVFDFANELLSVVPPVPREITSRKVLLDQIRLTTLILFGMIILLWLAYLLG